MIEKVYEVQVPIWYTKTVKIKVSEAELDDSAIHGKICEELSNQIEEDGYVDYNAIDYTEIK